jgi:hypothetical protein
MARQRRKKLNITLEKYFTGHSDPSGVNVGTIFLWFFAAILAIVIMFATGSYWALTPLVLMAIYKIAEKIYCNRVGRSYFDYTGKVHLDHDGNEMKLEGWYWDNDPAIRDFAESVIIDKTSLDVRPTVSTKTGTLISLLFLTVNINMDGASREEIFDAFKLVRSINPSAHPRVWFEQYFSLLLALAIADLSASGKFNPFASCVNVDSKGLEQMIVGYLGEKLQDFPKVKVSVGCEIQRFPEASLYPSTAKPGGVGVSSSAPE